MASDIEQEYLRTDRHGETIIPPVMSRVVWGGGGGVCVCVCVCVCRYVCAFLGGCYYNLFIKTAINKSIGN